jgi:manganese oxidase
VVVEPGTRRDPDADQLLVFSDGGPIISFLKPPPPIFLNGRAAPDTVELRAGRPHRLRLINIRTELLTELSLLDGERPVSWRVVAKDGADLPPAQIVERAARLVFAPGEIYDVEVTPATAGTLRLRFASVGPPAPAQTAVLRVR